MERIGSASSLETVPEHSEDSKKEKAKGKEKEKSKVKDKSREKETDVDKETKIQEKKEVVSEEKATDVEEKESREEKEKEEKGEEANESGQQTPSKSRKFGGGYGICEVYAILTTLFTLQKNVCTPQMLVYASNHTYTRYR